MLLTDEQIASASAYNKKEYDAGRLTDEHLAIAVAAFQQANGLTVDGKAGPNTRAALEAANAGEPADPVSPGLPVGKGMFVRSLTHTGEPQECVAHMQEHGLTWICVWAIWQYDDKDSQIINRSRMAEYAKAVHDAGFGFWVWGYPQPGKEAEFRDVIFEAADNANAEGVVIDPEKPYIGTEGAGMALMNALMPGCVERKILLGFTSYGSPWYFKTFPWDEFRSAHFAINQSYDADNNLPPEYPAQSQAAYKDLGFKVIIPGGGCYRKSEQDLRDLNNNTPTEQSAMIWWDWINATNDNLWGPIKEFVPGRCRETPDPS